MAEGRFKSNLRFALRKEAQGIRESTPLNKIEKFGDRLSWFAYEFKDHFLKLFYDPRFITVYLTGFAMILTSLLFYPSDTWRILSNTWQWFVDHINWSYVRFCLWVLSEATILGVGIRAFGRFTNQKLLDYYKSMGSSANG